MHPAAQQIRSQLTTAIQSQANRTQAQKTKTGEAQRSPGEAHGPVARCAWPGAHQASPPLTGATAQHAAVHFGLPASQRGTARPR